MSAAEEKAEALRLIEVDNTCTIGWETADAQHLANLAEAQVHATLYAAEQQRIANLIALGLGASSPDIREGLGLS